MSHNGNAEMLEAMRRMVREIVREELAAARPLTVAEAAARIGRSDGHIRDAIADGRLPHTRSGRSVRVLSRDVDALLTMPRAKKKPLPGSPAELAAGVDIGRRR